jgi:multidrug resistance efflux pump
VALQTITREEFDRRLDAANAQRTQEIETLEQQQREAEKLLAQYEHTLDEIEAELDSAPFSKPLALQLKRPLLI